MKMILSTEHQFCWEHLFGKLKSNICTPTFDWVTGFGSLRVGGLFVLFTETNLPELTWCRLEWELTSFLLMEKINKNKNYVDC